MDFIRGAIAVKGIGELLNERNQYGEAATVEEIERAASERQAFTSALAGHILQAFQTNRDARRNSLIEDEMFDSLRAYNGEYSPAELAKIRQSGGSEIFINLTGVKARAAASWIRDIELPAKERSWLLEPTPLPDLPKEIKAKVERAVLREFESYIVEPDWEAQQQPQQPQQALPAPAAPDAQQPQQQPPPPQVQQLQNAAPEGAVVQAPGEPVPQQVQQGKKTEEKVQSIKEFNQARRDVEEMVLAEINKIARHEMKQQERKIADQLAEGKWERAVSDFIDDFVVFPSAFIKGPIITKDNTLTYQQGKPVPSSKYLFHNRRVSPFDMYPSPDATTVDDATNIIEHIRFTRRELAATRDLPGYRLDEITKVLEEYNGSVDWLHSGIEGEKALNERRGDEWEANRDIVHGLHFFGSIEARLLKLWGIRDPEVQQAHDTVEYEVEAIVAGNRVIKCTRNHDPLRRRPYYKASYQTRPGSFWGRSLPSLMSDIQRMCNATARALANNMGLASGPQIELYVDRLADNGDITQIHPFKIWQLTSDPTGAGGRAIQFTQPTSNAAELLAVYKEFELRADDATGIPRYSYGNERVGGAAQTATGLSMLLESASKAIKDCVRNIDQGVVIPRIEYQFYWNIITDPFNNYTGDPKVIARGSSALTMKGAEQMRRNEFLQITSNAVDQQIMGLSGRAEILRAIAEDLNMGENIIPSRLELKAQQDKAQQQQAEMQQMDLKLKEAQISTGLQATKEQISGQERMHQQTQQFKLEELKAKQQYNELQAQIALAKLEAGREKAVHDNTARLQATQHTEAKKDERFNTEVALKLKRGEGI